MDGTPIYRKCFKGKKLPSSLQETFSYVLNLNVIIHVNDNWRQIPYTFSNTSYAPEWIGGVVLKDNGTFLYELGSKLTAYDSAFVSVIFM